MMNDKLQEQESEQASTMKQEIADLIIQQHQNSHATEMQALLNCMMQQMTFTNNPLHINHHQSHPHKKIQSSIMTQGTITLQIVRIINDKTHVPCRSSANQPGRLLLTNHQHPSTLSMTSSWKSNATPPQ